MPRTKRPLAEIEANESTRPRKGAKRDGKSKTLMENNGTLISETNTKPSSINGSKIIEIKPAKSDDPIIGSHSQSGSVVIRRPGMRYVLESALNPEPENLGEKIDYDSKDNSKLRLHLSDRGLPTTGTREHLISRLQNSSINYETLSSEQLVAMLKERHIKQCGFGPKSIKIARLRLNDERAEHSGDTSMSILIGKLGAFEWRMEELEKHFESTDYDSWTPAALSMELEKWRLKTGGNKKQQVARLRKADEKRITVGRFMYAEMKQEMEDQAGHPVDINAIWAKLRRISAKDHEICSSAPVPEAKFPTCKYDIKASHWAERTERELREICTRRGLNGWGTKATYVKWLDTGKLEYEDFSVTSLRIKCNERDIAHKNNDKKVDLIRRLREADRAQGVEEDIF